MRYKPLREDWIDRLGKRLRHTFFSWMFASSILMICAGVLLIPVQALFWLKDGVWPKWTLVKLAVHLTPYLPSVIVDWLVRPQDWIGLHKLFAWGLSWPIWSALLLGGLGLLLLSVGSAMGGDQGSEQGRGLST